MEDFEIQNSEGDNVPSSFVTNVRHCVFNFVSRLRSCFIYLSRCMVNDNESESNHDYTRHDSTYGSLVDIDMQDNRSSLITALCNGDTVAALRTIEHNSCYINERYQYGYTPLILCCIYMGIWQNKKREYSKIVRALLNYERCDINSRDDAGRSALMFASEYEQTECVDALLAHPRCKLLVRDINGETALHHLVQKSIDVEDSESILRLMVAHEEFASCTSIVTNEGFSALDLFLMNDKYFSPDFCVCSVAERLLSVLFNYIEHVQKSKRTIALAVRFTGIDMCKRLVKAGFDWDSSLPVDETAAHCAVQINDSEKLKLITKYFHRNAHLLETEWRGLNVYDLLKILKRDETIFRSFPNIPPLFPPARDTSGNMLKINNHSGLLTLSKHDISSKMQITNMEESGNSYSAYNAVKCATESNIMYRDDCNTIGRLSIKLALMISHEFSKHGKYELMQFEPQLSGSIRERTKCYFPDECDVLCRFLHSGILEHNYDPIRHAVSFSAKNNSYWDKLSNAYGQLITPRLNRAFYSAVDFVIQVGDFDYYAEEDGCILSLNKYSLHYEDKISRLVAHYNSPNFNELPVSIDLVPAIDCPDYQPPTPLPLGLRCSKYFALAKASRFDYSSISRSFPITYSSAEASLIGNVASHIKEGYITAKGLRLASICLPDVRLRDLGVSANIDIEKYITSYRLKNALFNILKDKERQPDAECKFEWADAIYAELQGSLMNDRRLPLW